MPSDLKRLKIFVSSPSDVSQEVDVAKKVIGEINQDTGLREGYFLEAVRWETHSSSGIASTAQEVITRDIGTDYDIYLGLMKSRFGTPVNGYGSGTEYEFSCAFERYRKDDQVEIMFFFFAGQADIDRLDLTQYGLVKEFRSRVGDEFGVRYSTYTDITDLSIKIRRDLYSRIGEILSRNDYKSDIVSSESVTDRLSNLNRLVANDPLAGITYHGLEFEHNIERCTKKIAAISKRINSVGESVSRLGKAANEPPRTSHDGKVKRISKEMTTSKSHFLKLCVQ